MTTNERGRSDLAARRLMSAGMIAIVVAAVAACGIPTGQESFSKIPDDEVPFRLAEQSTTTSTTTTTLPPTTIPPTTGPDTPETTADATTTTLPLETVAIYFLSSGELQAVPRELPQAYGIAQLAASLEAGPPEGAAGIGLDTLVEPGLIVDSTVEGGIVTVDLDEFGFDGILPGDQRPAIAQIVLTYTTNLRGVGQVTFTLVGEPVRVPKGNGLLSEPSEPLSFDDYANMLADRPTDSVSDDVIDEPPSTEPASTETPTAPTTPR